MSYKDYISDDEIFEEDDFDEDDDPDVYEYKIVGVTFKNDDGTNRQELLRKIKSREEPFKGFINYSLRVYSYEGKTAIAVLANGIMIGNVPKENAENIAEHMKYIDKVFVRVFAGEDGKKYGAVVRLTVIPPRIDIEKLLSEVHVMKKCPKCGSANIVEIAPNKNYRQWLCSDCSNIAKVKNNNAPEPTDMNKGKWINKLTDDEPKRTKPKAKMSAEEKSAREMCRLLSRIWIAAGSVLAAVLFIFGIVCLGDENGAASFVLYSVLAGFTLLVTFTVAAVLQYLTAKK